MAAVIPTPVRGWWEPKPGAVTHEVRVLCLCDDIEHCRTERYVPDVSLAMRELDECRRAREGTA